MALHYLTIQDILWINLQITKRTQQFNYARLEEATFYQYGYGQSSSVLTQAGRFLSGFIQKKPFATGNEAAAFVACLTFLKLNGTNVDLSDDIGVTWIERAHRDSVAASQALADAATQDTEHHDDELAADVRDTVIEIMDRFPKTLSLIVRGMHATLA
ncbi:MAG: death on curing protein [Fimbriimonadaceae bacterium]|jgi:prophage maintenance system killer protein|nr:death on curing protein [Fimbriimonadaceae bacterium]